MTLPPNRDTIYQSSCGSTNDRRHHDLRRAGGLRERLGVNKRPTVDPFTARQINSFAPDWRRDPRPINRLSGLALQHIHLTLLPAVGSKAQKLPLHPIDLGEISRANMTPAPPAAHHLNTTLNKAQAAP